MALAVVGLDRFDRLILPRRCNSESDRSQTPGISRQSGLGWRPFNVREWGFWVGCELIIAANLDQVPVTVATGVSRSRLSRHFPNCKLLVNIAMLRGYEHDKITLGRVFLHAVKVLLRVTVSADTCLYSLTLRSLFVPCLLDIKMPGPWATVILGPLFSLCNDANSNHSDR